MPSRRSSRRSSSQCEPIKTAGNWKEIQYVHIAIGGVCEMVSEGLLSEVRIAINLAISIHLFSYRLVFFGDFPQLADLLICGLLGLQSCHENSVARTT